MGVASIETLIKISQDDPHVVLAESDSLVSEKLERSHVVKFFNDSAERVSKDWQIVCSLRKTVDDALIAARKLYRDSLKKTESSALRGQPRLYWLAKSLFARLRTDSLRYQIKETDAKINALREAKANLGELLQKFQISITSETSDMLGNTSLAEAKSKKHAIDLQVEWEKSQSLRSQNLELRKKTDRIEIQQAVAEALVSEMVFYSHDNRSDETPRHIDSPRMMTSRLPYLGFSNRPKLMTLVEQSEFAAQHAEQDLEKVREGLRLANDSAVEGCATSLSMEWLDYCRMIVARYEQLAGSQATPH